MPYAARVGQRLPPVVLGELVNGEIRRVALESLLAGRRAVVFGVPGAFTPICSQRHAPEFIAKAPALRKSGIDAIICIGPNDPWTMAAWAESIDPTGQVRFMSDGNLEFARQTGLVESHPDYFLGERLKRFVMITQDAVVEHLGVENALLSLSCSRVDDVFTLV